MAALPKMELGERRQIVVESPLDVAQVRARLAQVLEGGLVLRWPGPRYQVRRMPIGKAEFIIRGEALGSDFRAAVEDYEPHLRALNHRRTLLGALNDDDDNDFSNPFTVVLKENGPGARLEAMHEEARRLSPTARFVVAIGLAVVGLALVFLLDLAVEHVLLRSLPSWSWYVVLAVAAVYALVDSPLVEADQLAMLRVLELVADPAVTSLAAIPADQPKPTWPAPAGSPPDPPR